MQIYLFVKNEKVLDKTFPLKNQLKILEVLKKKKGQKIPGQFMDGSQ